MENKERMKKEVEELAADMVRPIRLASAVIAVECPEVHALLIPAIVEKLKALLPREQNEACTCPGEGPGGQKDTCCEYKPVRYFDFGAAIQAVKQGKSVARKGWNGKHQYVELATCISYKGPAGEIVNAHHNNIGNAALAFIGTSGVQLGWLASQADMLAKDWYIVE